MKESNTIYAILLFGSYALTKAAPPPTSPSSAILSLINATAAPPALHNLTFPHTSPRLSVGPAYNARFPPGPEPPEGYLFYDVPFANPRMNIKFRDYDLQPERNESDVDRCFQKAVMECGDRAKHFIEMEDHQFQCWESGDVLFGIVPKKEDGEQGLTYGIFTDALQGLNNFRLFYPHLDFDYEIFVYPGEKADETYVGIGQLITLEEGGVNIQKRR